MHLGDRGGVGRAAIDLGLRRDRAVDLQEGLGRVEAVEPRREREGELVAAGLELAAITPEGMPLAEALPATARLLAETTRRLFPRV